MNRVLEEGHIPVKPKKWYKMATKWLETAWKPCKTVMKWEKWCKMPWNVTKTQVCDVKKGQDTTKWGINARKWEDMG